MAITDIPGLAEIQAAAPRYGIDIGPTLEKARMLMQTDPVAVRTGGGQLTTLVGGMDTGHEELRTAGSGALANWSGVAADAFAPHHAGLVNHVADTRNVTGELARHLEQVASVFEASQQTVLSAFGVAATALRMLGE